jgi:hypothetical protein
VTEIGLSTLNRYPQLKQLVLREGDFSKAAIQRINHRLSDVEVIVEKSVDSAKTLRYPASDQK